MKHIRLIKILFLIAGLMLSVKPLLGFSLVHQAESEDSTVNITLLQKLFSKRKQDYLEDDLTQIIAIQQVISDISLGFIYHLCYLVFSYLAWPFLALYYTTNRYLFALSLRIIPERSIYLALGKLTI